MATTYSIHDLETQEQLIREAHRADSARAFMHKMRTGIEMPIWDLQKALERMERRYRKRMGLTGKYQPHQGKREMARRRGDLRRVVVEQTA